MQARAFEQYMLGRNLAEKTREQRGYALKRIERAYDIDLDAEFERDQLSAVLNSFAYSASDERSTLSNPSKLDIDPDKLLTHLRWYRSHLVDYIRFRAGIGSALLVADSVQEDTPPGENVLEEAIGKTFALERDLQSALRANLAQLEQGLRVEDGGSERKVAAGFIDILARDPAGMLTVIELKADIARPDAVAQILSYMGCIAEETGQAVRGILVASDHHPRVVHAARAVPNLTLRRYRFRFEFD